MRKYTALLFMLILEGSLLTNMEAKSLQLQKNITATGLSPKSLEAVFRCHFDVTLKCPMESEVKIIDALKGARRYASGKRRPQSRSVSLRFGRLLLWR